MEITKPSLRHLYDLGREGGVVRFKASTGTLYTSQKRGLDHLNRKVDQLKGQATPKRLRVLDELKRVFAEHGLNFSAVMEATGFVLSILLLPFSWLVR